MGTQGRWQTRPPLPTAPRRWWAPIYRYDLLPPVGRQRPDPLRQPRPLGVGRRGGASPRSEREQPRLPIPHRPAGGGGIADRGGPRSDRPVPPSPPPHPLWARNERRHLWVYVGGWVADPERSVRPCPARFYTGRHQHPL